MLMAAFFYVLVIWIFVEWVNRPIIHTNVPQSSTTAFMFSELEKADSIDLLFMGSSHSYRGINPSVFDTLGWHSFNMGTSSQTPRHSLILIKYYINRMKLKMLVIEVYMPVFSTSMNLVEPNLAILSNASFSTEFLGLFKLATDIRMFNLFLKSLLLKLRNEPSLATKVVEVPGERYLGKGYVERTDSMKHPDSFDVQEVKIDSLQVIALREIIRLAEEKKIVVKLIQMPVTDNLYKSFVNKNDFDRLMSSMAEYHNLNGKISLADTLHFYDSNHLNAEGVRKVQPLLISIIGPPTNKKKDSLPLSGSTALY